MAVWQARVSCAPTNTMESRKESLPICAIEAITTALGIDLTEFIGKFVWQVQASRASHHKMSYGLEIEPIVCQIARPQIGQNRNWGNGLPDDRH